MENYFNSQIASMSREITTLKTASQKSAGQIEVASKSINISIPLSLNASQTTASGDIYFLIKSSKPVISFVTLDHYYDDIAKANLTPRQTRSLSVSKYVSPNGIGIRVLGYGTQGPNSDVSTLINGGSVTLTATMTVKCTDDFSIEEA